MKTAVPPILQRWHVVSRRWLAGHTYIGWLATRTTVLCRRVTGQHCVPAAVALPANVRWRGQNTLPSAGNAGVLAAHSCHWFAGRLLQQMYPPAPVTSTQTTRTTVTAQTNIIIDAALLAKWQPGIPLPRQIGQGASCQLLPLENCLRCVMLYSQIEGSVNSAKQHPVGMCRVRWIAEAGLPRAGCSAIGHGRS